MKKLSREMKFDLKCPKCGRAHKTSFADLKPGTEIPCECGTTIRIGNDGFQSAGKALDDFQKSLK